MNTELVTGVASLDTSDYTKMSGELFGDIPVSERIPVTKLFPIQGLHVGDVTTSDAIAARQSRWESRDNQDENAPLPG